jgi:hypothetical protein
MPNRLSHEASPYLLQHQDNPVDWYPWGDDAVARARAENKPIFLSVGYSTCHWCHVMSHESFEDGAIAEVLNREFVPVKVDREERPDVDRVYMMFVQATTGAGGWPMSVWLTPDLEPFYGGTYFPPTARWGRPGFIDILREIARAWREERAHVVASATSIVSRLREVSTTGRGELPGVGALDLIVAEYVRAFDVRHGGFGDAPKFPRPGELLFLLREHRRTGASPPAQMALATLDAMAEGGVRDHLGGGFHRYAVDEAWRVPHFEKMLYDQAQLSLAYLEALALTRDERYGAVAADTLTYVERELTDPGGGFYSAEDADSVPPDEAGKPHPHLREGAFYVWTDAELRRALGPDAEVFASRFGVLPEGNAPADPQGEFTGQNLLYGARTVTRVAADLGLSDAQVVASLQRSRAALVDLRRARPRPHLDDKVLTAWNGLMLGACARAARLLPGGERYLAMARRAAVFLRESLWDEDARTLGRRYRAGASAMDGYAEDYASLVFGLLELFQAGGGAEWLEWAFQLQRRMDELFWDDHGGGWFSTTGEDSSVILRLKEDYDGAEPAASSLGAMNLLVMSQLTGDGAVQDRLRQTLEMFAPRVAGSGRTVPVCAAVLSMMHAGASQVVVTGADSPGGRALLDELARHYLPASVVVPVTTSDRARLETMLPWVRGMTSGPGEAAAYVCRNFTCLLPAYDVDALGERLGTLTRHPR